MQNQDKKLKLFIFFGTIMIIIIVPIIFLKSNKKNKMTDNQKTILDNNYSNGSNEDEQKKKTEEFKKIIENFEAGLKIDDFSEEIAFGGSILEMNERDKFLEIEIVDNNSIRKNIKAFFYSGTEILRIKKEEIEKINKNEEEFSLKEKISFNDLKVGNDVVVFFQESKKDQSYCLLKKLMVLVE